MVDATYSARQVAAASFIQPVTLHSWHSDRIGLVRDAAARSGRRYSFADAVVVGLVATLADDLNGFGIPVRLAAALCNRLRPFIEAQIASHKPDIYVSLDGAQPVAVARRSNGAPGGWEVQTFDTIAQYNAWGAAQEPHIPVPPLTRTWRGGHELLIDIAGAVKRAGVSLSRYDVWQRSGEAGSDD